MVSTALTDLFGLTYPIIQAPMANASGGDLAREVAKAGALGMIGTGTRANAEWLQAEWRKLDGASRVGVGFMTWALDRYEEQRGLLRLALALKPAAVLLSFGDPRPYAAAIRQAGARLICQVQTAADAQLAAEAGADLIVAQGTEAGGHTGRVDMRSLLSGVLKVAGSIPVAAAGGIGTGQDVARALAMGACGAMLGTRFVATPECLYPQGAKERILKATVADTVLTRVFDMVQGIPWPEQYPGRALTNRFTERWHRREGALQADLEQARTDYESARSRGDYDTLVVYAGRVAGRINEIVPAGELVRRIGEETNEAVQDGVDHLLDAVYRAIDRQDEDCPLTLEDYLRALWGLVQEHREATPSYTLFGELLAASFDRQPVPFDRAWLQDKRPPRSDDGSFAALESTLLFQVADLRRIAESGQEMGPWDNVAPTGQTWNNLSPLPYLECAMQGVSDHLRAGTPTAVCELSVRPTWGTLAAILELGRLYE